MKITSSVLVNVSLVIVLMSSMFLVGLTSSIGEYDPWLDTNDDGRIDMRDIGDLARAFGTAGDSAKNVTITGHATKVLTLAYNYDLPYQATWNSGFVEIDGYAKVTVLVRIDTNNNVMDIVAHATGSYFVETVYDINQWCETYDVMAPYLYIYVANLDVLSASLYVELYLLA